MRSDKLLKTVKESTGKIVLILINEVIILEKTSVPEWDEERIRVIKHLKETIDILKKVI